MNKDYYVLAMDSYDTIYCTGPFTWDDAIRHLSDAMEFGVSRCDVVDASKVYTWAEEVLADV